MDGAAPESLMYRVSIIYPGRTGQRFDWDYYLSRHLPLALGTSMRHSAVAACDLDRPLVSPPDWPHRCICVVRFADGGAMEAFRTFFASGHGDTAAIIEDEPNYTDIHPRFICAVANRQGYGGAPAAPPACRMRVLFPATGSSRFDFERFRWVVEPALVERLAAHAPILFSELDRCSSGLIPGSAPDYDALWTLYFENPETALKVVRLVEEALREELQRAFGDVSATTPEMLVSDLVSFDLNAAAAVAAGNAAHA